MNHPHTDHTDRCATGAVRGMTAAQVGRLPVVIDLVTAARALGIGRTKAYQLARTGRFPCRVQRVGHSYRVFTADLLTVLGLPAPVIPTDSAEPPLSGQPPASRKEK
ncbi:helix-turn-helix domain-containing protein [Spirillospora sp. NPDC127200]